MRKRRISQVQVKSTQTPNSTLAKLRYNDSGRKEFLSVSRGAQGLRRGTEEPAWIGMFCLWIPVARALGYTCLLYTSDAADDWLVV